MKQLIFFVNKSSLSSKADGAAEAISSNPHVKDSLLPFGWLVHCPTSRPSASQCFADRCPICGLSMDWGCFPRFAHGLVMASRAQTLKERLGVHKSDCKLLSALMMLSQHHGKWKEACNRANLKRACSFTKKCDCPYKFIHQFLVFPFLRSEHS